MKRISLLFIISFLFSASFLFAQTKKPLDHSVYASWKTLSGQKISDDGLWASFEINPARGDGKLNIVNLATKKPEVFSRGKGLVFSANSNFAFFRVSPPFEKIRSLKIAKKKADDLPKDTLYIKSLTNETLVKHPNIKSFKAPEKKSDWLAVLFDKEPPAKPDTAKNKVKSKIKKEGTKLLILNPAAKKEYLFENVADYSASKNGAMFSFTSQVKDSLDSCSVFVFDTQKEKAEKIFYKQGFAKTSVIDEKGEQVTFLFSADTASVKNYNLYYWNTKSGKTECLVDSLNKSMPKGWAVSENAAPYFSQNGEKLYFGTAKRQRVEPKDTLLTEEKAVFDLWSYTDPYLQTQQLKELSNEKKRTYLAVYNFDDGKMLQLGNENLENIITLEKGNSDIYAAYTSKELAQLVSWDQSYTSYYVIDGKTGGKKLLLKNHSSQARISPEGKYFLYYEPKDSCWYSMNIKEGTKLNLTKNIKAAFYNKDNDVPAAPSPRGISGFTKDDEKVLIYDYYDIWVIDPNGDDKPYSLTNGYAEKKKTVFHYLNLDRDIDYIDFEKPLLLKGFDKVSREESFWYVNANKNNEMTLLVQENFRFTNPVKAKDADAVIWQKGNFKSYPEMYASNADFKNPALLSETNPQQKEYLWGSVELVNWVSGAGDPLEGLLYKPENFDPSKKYPMLIYFYERNSDNINNHPIPSPSRSTINIPYFVSNGYIVFVPDIIYKVGYPGQGAYDCIVSGALAMINKGFVDKNAIGIQGQSWGGYQTAYLITRTNMFAAAGAGAPVSNMTSAYGGIRLESGMSRMFQYEKEQSRIGATLWEKPMRYIENSPLFFADKVETPLLMTHNDNDGAVPWQQGIEYFSALRRLNKPVWMISYNGDEHNLKAESWGNRVDLSIRLAQFFDHYLKGKPMPKWMKEGIPAVKKGKTFGYEE